MVYTNNLIIDYEKRVMIPQNEEDYFIIGKTNIIKNSIEVSINPHKTIEMINLYTIIRSFASNLIYIPHRLMVSIKNSGDNTIITSNLNVEEFKKMRYYPFCVWFQDQLFVDWKYIKQDSSYTILFSYPVDIFERKNLEFLQPKFPWKDELIQTLRSIEIRDDLLLRELEEKNRIIERLISEKSMNNPDYKVKTRENIEYVIKNWDHFKNEKKIVLFIDRLGRDYFDNDEYLLSILKKILSEVESKELDEVKLKKLEAFTSVFISKNDRKYIKKVINKDWTLYEYEKFYELFINNKKIDINSNLELIFKENDKITLYLDGAKWLDYKNATKTDFDNSNKIKFRVEK